MQPPGSFGPGAVGYLFRSQRVSGCCSTSKVTNTTNPLPEPRRRAPEKWQCASMPSDSTRTDETLPFVSRKPSALEFHRRIQARPASQDPPAFDASRTCSIAQLAWVCMCDAALSGHHTHLRGVLHAHSVMERRVRVQSVSSPPTNWSSELLPTPQLDIVKHGRSVQKWSFFSDDPSARTVVSVHAG